ncbi:unnamed protein product [Lepidochelys olivacea]
MAASCTWSGCWTGWLKGRWRCGRPATSPAGSTASTCGSASASSLPSSSPACGRCSTCCWLRPARCTPTSSTPPSGRARPAPDPAGRSSSASSTDSLATLLLDGPGGTRILFHASFAEWLLDVKFCTQRSLCSAAEGHGLLAISAAGRAPTRCTAWPPTCWAPACTCRPASWRSGWCGRTCPWPTACRLTCRHCP